MSFSISFLCQIGLLNVITVCIFVSVVHPGLLFLRGIHDIYVSALLVPIVHKLFSNALLCSSNFNNLFYVKLHVNGN